MLNMEMNENFANGFIVLGHDRGNMNRALIQKARKLSSYIQLLSLSVPVKVLFGELSPTIIRRNAGPKLSLTTKHMQLDTQKSREILIIGLPNGH